MSFTGKNRPPYDSIARVLKVQLTTVDSTRLGAVVAVNPQGHEHYLKGR